MAGIRRCRFAHRWSGEFGYEVFAPDVEPARRVWQEVRGIRQDPFGVLVTPAAVNGRGSAA